MTTPARQPYNVTPHDTNPLNPIPKYLYIGGAGTVNLRADHTDANTTFTVTAGTTLHVAAEFVYATGTSATNIVAMV